MAVVRGRIVILYLALSVCMLPRGLAAQVQPTSNAGVEFAGEMPV